MVGKRERKRGRKGERKRGTMYIHRVLKKTYGYIYKGKVVFFDTVTCCSRSRGQMRLRFKTVKVKMQSERK